MTTIVPPPLGSGTDREKQPSGGGLPKKQGSSTYRSNLKKLHKHAKSEVELKRNVAANGIAGVVGNYAAARDGLFQQTPTRKLENSNSYSRFSQSNIYIR